ncbi:MAG: response regulator [Rhodospirillales bacterium]|nr:response regulator [Alphaproteobacteria bacterium]MCB1840880.1 response regulator [Alphaproteobacteria bacterium]MCB9977060.1 response regulator [Rhodospirillales bacterium]
MSLLKLEKLSTLVVEDTEPMLHLITAVLEKLGVGTIIPASNGNEAFSAFCRHSPDIIITDWHMTPVNGIELANYVRRSSSSPNRLVPIIMLTGYNAAARITESRDQGITEFLTKPFHAHDLIRRIMHVIRSPRDFVLNESYFGPDRRRRKNIGYRGPLRRIGDKTD